MDGLHKQNVIVPKSVILRTFKVYIKQICHINKRDLYLDHRKELKNNIGTQHTGNRFGG